MSVTRCETIFSFVFLVPDDDDDDDDDDDESTKEELPCFHCHNERCFPQKYFRIKRQADDDDDDDDDESTKEARINDEDILKMINRPIPCQSNKDMQSMIDEHCPPILVDDMKSNGCFLLCVKLFHLFFSTGVHDNG